MPLVRKFLEQANVLCVVAKFQSGCPCETHMQSHKASHDLPIFGAPARMCKPSGMSSSTRNGVGSYVRFCKSSALIVCSLFILSLLFDIVAVIFIFDFLQQYRSTRIDFRKIVEKMYFDQLLDFVYVEFMKGLQKGFVPKRCANCGRWFLQKPGGNLCLLHRACAWAGRQDLPRDRREQQLLKQGGNQRCLESASAGLQKIFCPHQKWTDDQERV